MLPDSRHAAPDRYGVGITGLVTVEKALTPIAFHARTRNR
jgi:hypothetical protein